MALQRGSKYNLCIRRLTFHKLYTLEVNLETHESPIFGMMCNLINFPENNPAIHNSFSCGQSKQAVYVNHKNYQKRMDKSTVFLNDGQTVVLG